MNFGMEPCRRGEMVASVRYSLGTAQNNQTTSYLDPSPRTVHEPSKTGNLKHGYGQILANALMVPVKLCDISGPPPARKVLFSTSPRPLLGAVEPEFPGIVNHLLISNSQAVSESHVPCGWSIGNCDREPLATLTPTSMPGAYCNHVHSHPYLA